MIRYESFSFAAAPRTGSTWFSLACTAVGLRPLNSGAFAKHEPDPDISNQRFRVTMVRSPMAWLESFYETFHHGGPQTGVPQEVVAFTRLAKEYESLSDFIRGYLDSGLTVSSVFDVYRADTCIRVEDLPWSALEFFESIGCPKARVDEIRRWVPINARKYKRKLDSQQMKELRRRIFDKERSFCERCEYYPT